MSVPPFDPASAPLLNDVLQPDEDPLPPGRLDRDWLRARFLNPPRWNPEPVLRPPSAQPFHACLPAGSVSAPIPCVSRDQDLLDPPPPKLMPAAVLIPLVPCADGLGVILTVRSRELHRHRGQIAFPGGRIDAGDASARAAALREAWEEIGLSSSLVDVLGDLPWHETGSGYRVRPVVGLLDAPLRLEGLSLQRAEVGEVFIVPLSFLMNPVHHQRRLGRWVQGDRPVTRVFYSMPWQSPSGREYFIWGATASMLRNLYHFLAAD